MGIGIYTDVDPSTALSEDSAFTHPFATTFDGRVGGYKEFRLYIRNDDDTLYYSDLTLSLNDESDNPIISRPEDGFVWKLSYGDTKPTYNDWLNTPVANTLTVTDDLGGPGDPDSSTYLPFWVFIQVPSNLDVQLFSNVKFVLSGTQGSV